MKNDIADERIIELLNSNNEDDVKLGIIVGMRNREEDWWKQLLGEMYEDYMNHYIPNRTIYTHYRYKGYEIRLGENLICFYSMPVDNIVNVESDEIINIEEYE